MVTYKLSLLLFLLVAISTITLTFKKDGCRLKWNTTYHMNGHSALLHFNETWIETLGYCVASSSNHQNYIFRFELPPFNFTYTTQDGSCTSRVSSLTACPEYGKYRFGYEACPELPNYESHVDELECIAHWNSFGVEFFAVRITNSSITVPNTIFRCLIHQKRVFGGYMGISADSSCDELTDLAYAGMKIKYTQGSPLISYCHFPSFLEHSHYSSGKNKWMSMTIGSMNDFYFDK
ncbi:hypothetical protein ACH3XW_18275 [Acanthocheilonema viteae]